MDPFEDTDTAPGPVLGRDPFELEVDFDPFLAGLDALGVPAADAEESETTPPRPASPTRVRPPTLAELEPLPPRGAIERLLGADERQRMAALQHLVEGELSYDHRGLSPEVLRRVFPLFYALYRLYFRVQSKGHEHLAIDGGGILAANHGGLLPSDGAMLIVDALLHTDPPRLLRSIVDYWAGDLPFVNVLFARIGQVIGTRENFADLLSDGQLVLVFPEGIDGIRKTIDQRFRLQTFHVGFVEEALRHQVPIIPTAVVGSDDQAPILLDFPRLARRLGLPAIPITPTFPWLGPLGLLPYPVQYRIVYGEPLAFHERFSPADAEDPRLVRYLARTVRHRVQRLIDDERNA